MEPLRCRSGKIIASTYIRVCGFGFYDVAIRVVTKLTVIQIIETIRKSVTIKPAAA